MRYYPKFWHRAEYLIDHTRHPYVCSGCGHAETHQKKGEGNAFEVRLCYIGPRNAIEADPSHLQFRCYRCTPKPKDPHYNAKAASKLTGEMFPSEKP